MRRLAILVAMVGCGGSSPPATTPANVAAQPELRCKSAVEQASAAVTLRDKDVTMAIGECEQHEWPQPARQCIAAAKTNDALVTCSATYSLGKHGIFASSTSMEAALEAMAGFRDKICACKDSACAQAVSDEMVKWSEQLAKEDNDGPPKMTEDQTKRATDIGEEMGKCMQAAMGSGTATP